VSPICLGTMNFGLGKGWEWAGRPPFCLQRLLLQCMCGDAVSTSASCLFIVIGNVSKVDAFAIMDEYVKQGGNFLDTGKTAMLCVDTLVRVQCSDA